MTALGDAAAWARNTFGDGRTEAHAMKAAHEWEEWRAAATTREAALEAADVVIALAAWCDSAGYDLEELTAAKVRVNRRRTWEQQPDGTFQHR